jgi:GT2 family glycosyltransferase
MNIAFVCVNYNNWSFTNSFLKSCLQFNLNNEIKIIVVDNASNDSDLNNLRNCIYLLKDDRIQLLESSSNVGYFRGLNIGLSYLNKNTYDYIIIGNNDITFDNSFLKTLRNSDFSKEIFVVSPDIVRPDGIHQNPHSLFPYSKLKIFYKHIYFKNFFIASVIQLIVNYFKSKFHKQQIAYQYEGPIFMGYGACYILTKSFLSHFSSLDSNLFLMGEEGALSNQVVSKGGKVYYCPSLKVFHNDHSTIGKLPGKFIFDQNKIAFKYFINECKALQGLGK